MHKIKIVSMGPGDIDQMTWEAVKALHWADVLIGAEKYAELYPEYGVLVPDKLVSGTIQLIKDNIDRKIAVMVTGDAGFYSLGKSIIKEFGCDNVHVIAGVGIVQFAFSKLCEPWEDAVYYSGHGRELNTDITDDKFMILCDRGKNMAADVISRIIDKTETHDIYGMEALTLPDENIVKINNIKDIEKLKGNSLGIVIGIKRGNE